LQGNIKKTGFAGIVAVNSPFAKHLNSHIEMIEIEHVKLADWKFTLGLQGQYKSGECLGGWGGRIPFNEFSSSFDGTHDMTSSVDEIGKIATADLSTESMDMHRLHENHVIPAIFVQRRNRARIQQLPSQPQASKQARRLA
jgi:hypothetical protein